MTGTRQKEILRYTAIIKETSRLEETQIKKKEHKEKE